MVNRLKKKLFAITETTVLVFSIWLALSLESGSARYSWTDTIIIYKGVTSVYTDIRTFTNNETFPIDVKVYITRRNAIHILQYYKLSANKTDFIIISEGRVVRSGDTYFGLGSGQKLCFTVEAKPMNSVVVGDTATVGINIRTWRRQHGEGNHDDAFANAKTLIEGQNVGY